MNDSVILKDEADEYINQAVAMVNRLDLVQPFTLDESRIIKPGWSLDHMLILCFPNLSSGERRLVFNVCFDADFFNSLTQDCKRLHQGSAQAGAIFHPVEA